VRTLFASGSPAELIRRLADARLQACGFYPQACCFEKPVSKLKMAGFRRIFLHFSTSEKKK